MISVLRKIIRLRSRVPLMWLTPLEVRRVPRRTAKHGRRKTRRPPDRIGTGFGLSYR